MEICGQFLALAHALVPQGPALDLGGTILREMPGGQALPKKATRGDQCNPTTHKVHSTSSGACCHGIWCSLEETQTIPSQ